MTVMQFLFAFASFWVGTGLAAFVYFHWWMDKNYKVPKTVYESGYLLFELFFALLAGPVNWLAIAIIIGDDKAKIKDKDDEDNMEI